MEFEAKLILQMIFVYFSLGSLLVVSFFIRPIKLLTLKK